MRPNGSRLSCRILGWIVLLLGPALAAQEAQPPPIPEQELPEVLNRGPVHEAFAEPVPLTNQAPLSVQPAPPAPINEQPPEERPQGQFVWVPGYWAWDPDRENYIWVSGCWRSVPPGMYWVPGYWVEDEGRWEWVSGFWAPVQNREIEYLPAPPPLNDVQPPGPAPANGIWIAPCWYWYQGEYVLRPGYWLDAQPDWIWQPSHYIWTPRGYVFVQGHWDYDLDRRGVLYAPVYFPRPYSYTRTAYYTPSVVVEIGVMPGFLFTYSRYNHYYFGDWYDRSYLGIGIHPWFETVLYSSWYDPIYHHHRWRHHHYDHDTEWERRIRDIYNRRVANPDQRPARTHREWEQRRDRLPDDVRRQYRLTRSWRESIEDQERPMPVQRLDAEARRNLTEQVNDVQRLRQERNRWESAEGRTSPGRADTVTVPGEARPERDERPARPDRDRTRDTTLPSGPSTPSIPSTPAPGRDRPDRPDRDRTRDTTLPSGPSTPSVPSTPSTPAPDRDRPDRTVQPVPQPQPQPQPQPPVTVPASGRDRPDRPDRDRTPTLPSGPSAPSIPSAPSTPSTPAPGRDRPDRPGRAVQPVPQPQPQPQPSVPSVPAPARQPRVRVTQPERVPVPQTPYTQPPATPVPPGMEKPPEPSDEIRIRRGRP